MAPAGSSRIGEHRDSLGAHERPVDLKRRSRRDKVAVGFGATPRPPPHSCDRACRHGWVPRHDRTPGARRSAGRL
eukprot:7383178-Prymnesium_polylepis.1